MKTKILFSIFLLGSAALAFIPLAAAQDTSALSGAWDTLSNLPSQAVSYVSEHPVVTAGVAVPSTIAGGLGLAYKSVSAAKSKLQSTYDSLKGQAESVSQKASDAMSELQTVKDQADIQINGFKKTAEDAVKKAKEAEDKLETVTQQKAAALNELEQLKEQLKTAQTRYDELRSHMP